MKFLAFVDLHEDRKVLQKLLERAKQEDIDFLVCAGDLSQFGHNLGYVLRQ
ncbi:MAG: metallophosphoesterase [Nanoarchaeota archaeon]